MRTDQLFSVGRIGPNRCARHQAQGKQKFTVQNVCFWDIPTSRGMTIPYFDQLFGAKVAHGLPLRGTTLGGLAMHPVAPAGCEYHTHT